MSAKFRYIADDLSVHKTERQKQKAKKEAERVGGSMKKGTRERALASMNGLSKAW